MSVPGAVATAYGLTKLDLPANRDPVATAPGTDCITAMGRKLRQYLDFSLPLIASTIATFREGGASNVSW
jgi:hypothetical protein